MGFLVGPITCCAYSCEAGHVTAADAHRDRCCPPACQCGDRIHIEVLVNDPDLGAIAVATRESTGARAYGAVGPGSLS